MNMGLFPGFMFGQMTVTPAPVAIAKPLYTWIPQPLAPAASVVPITAPVPAAPITPESVGDKAAAVSGLGVPVWVWGVAGLGVLGLALSLTGD